MGGFVLVIEWWWVGFVLVSEWCWVGFFTGERMMVEENFTVE
jgi:hypothetical protein